MSTQPVNPTPPSVDDAYSAFKTIEATLTTDQAALTSAQAALATAQTNVANAQNTVNTDTAQALTIVDALINAAQAFRAGLQPPAATPTA